MNRETACNKNKLIFQYTYIQGSECYFLTIFQFQMIQLSSLPGQH